MEVIVLVVGAVIAYSIIIDAYGYVVDANYRRGDTLITHLVEPYKRLGKKMIYHGK